MTLRARVCRPALRPPATVALWLLALATLAAGLEWRPSYAGKMAAEAAVEAAAAAASAILNEPILLKLEFGDDDAALHMDNNEVEGVMRSSDDDGDSDGDDDDSEHLPRLRREVTWDYGDSDPGFVSGSGKLDYMEEFEMSETKERLATIYDLVDHFRQIGKSFSKGFMRWVRHKLPPLFDVLTRVPPGETMFDPRPMGRPASDLDVWNDFTKYAVLLQMYYKNSDELHSVYSAPLFGPPIGQGGRQFGAQHSHPDDAAVAREGDRGLGDLMYNVHRAEDVLQHMEGQVKLLLKDLANEVPQPPGYVRQAQAFYARQVATQLPDAKDMLVTMSSNTDRGSNEDKAMMMMALAEHRLLNIMLYRSLFNLLNTIDEFLPEELLRFKKTGFKNDPMFLLNAARALPGDSKVPKNLNKFDQVMASKFSKMVAERFAQYLLEQVTETFQEDMTYLFNFPFMAPYRDVFTKSETILMDMITRRTKSIINNLSLKELLFEFGVPPGPDAGAFSKVALRMAQKELLRHVVPLGVSRGKQIIAALGGKSAPHRPFRG